MPKSLPPSGVSARALSAWIFSISEHGSDARLYNHFVLTNIPQSADNHICQFVPYTHTVKKVQVN